MRKSVPKLHEELREIRDPVLHKVLAHPFWAGLRDGSLPAPALAYFVEQDTGVLLPAYARALARCAAAAPDDADALLLGQSIVGTLAARARLRDSYTALASELGWPALRDPVTADPATLAHTHFLADATARSFFAGAGALLPMVWFNAEVSDGLKQGAGPGSRYERWIDAYHPGESYGHAVRAFLDLVDRAAATGTATQRRQLVEQFSIGVRYEWKFAECCLAQHQPHG